MKNKKALYSPGKEIRIHFSNLPKTPKPWSFWLENGFNVKRCFIKI